MLDKLNEAIQWFFLFVSLFLFCLGECCKAVLLQGSRIVLWNKILSTGMIED